MAEKKSTASETETRIVTTMAGNVRITEPKGSSRKRRPKITVLVSPDDMVREHVGGFVNFLREHAIVGLAVGFVIATQVQGVVKELIAGFLDPLSKLLFGTSLSTQTFTWHFRGHTADFEWGAVVFTLIDFLFVVLVIYIIIKLFKLDKLDKPKK